MGGFQIGLVAGLMLLLGLYIAFGLPQVRTASLSLTTPVTYQSLLATTGLLAVAQLLQEYNPKQITRTLVAIPHQLL